MLTSGDVVELDLGTPSGREAGYRHPAVLGLHRPSSAQCQHVRAVATGRIDSVLGNVGAVILSEVRELLGLILDIPG